MDYSNNDVEYPGGSSPWASSPQHNRTSFGQPPTSDIPSSPLPPQASPYGQDSEQYGYMGHHTQNSRPSTDSTENGESYPAVQQQQQHPSQDAPQLPQHPNSQQQASQPGQQPQRYHGTRPQRQQQHYKLQAKVTGLERNGKKDPIIRFDVYVRAGHGDVSLFAANTSGRPICLSSERLNSATCVEYTRNSLSSAST